MAARFALIHILSLMLFGCGDPNMPNSDFLVQHFEITVGAGQDLVNVGIPVPIDPAHTRILMGSWTDSATSIGQPPGGLTASDVAVTLKIVGDRRVAVKANPNRANPSILRFSLLSYVGTDGGENEFTVVSRFTHVVDPLDAIAINEFSFAELGISPASYAKATAHRNGSYDPDPSSFSGGTLRGAAVGIYDADNGGDESEDYTVAIAVGVVAFGTGEVEIEVIDWNGSNWQVERHNTNVGDELVQWATPETPGGYADASIEINDIGAWDNAWIEGHRGPFVSEEVGGFLAWPGSDTEHVNIGWSTGGINVADTALYSIYVLSNPEIYVEHWSPQFGNSTDEIDETVFTVFPIPEESQINQLPNQIFPLLSGYLMNSDVEGLSPVEHTEHGDNDWSFSYNSSFRGIIVNHSKAVGKLRHHSQLVQLTRDAAPDSTTPGSVIDQPKIELDFTSQ